MKPYLGAIYKTRAHRKVICIYDNAAGSRKYVIMDIDSGDVYGVSEDGTQYTYSEHETDLMELIPVDTHEDVIAGKLLVVDQIKKLKAQEKAVEKIMDDRSHFQKAVDWYKSTHIAFRAIAPFALLYGFVCSAIYLLVKVNFG